MAISPTVPFPKSAGDLIRSTDWNQAVNEVVRLDGAKVSRAGDVMSGSLTVQGALAAQLSASVAGWLTVGGALTVTGAATMNGALTVAGLVRLSSRITFNDGVEDKIYLHEDGGDRYGFGYVANHLRIFSGEDAKIALGDLSTAGAFRTVMTIRFKDRPRVGINTDTPSTAYNLDVNGITRTIDLKLGSGAQLKSGAAASRADVESDFPGAPLGSLYLSTAGEAFLKTATGTWRKIDTVAAD